MVVERGDSAPVLGLSDSRRKGLLRDQLQIVKVKSNGKLRYAIQPLDEQLSFDKGFYVFIRAVQYLTSHNQGIIVVGLAGPSGSGKTVFSEKVQHFLPGCAVLSMDMYNDGSRVIDSNFDDPRLTDYDTLLGNIQDLKAGRPTEVPIYDFKQSKRVGYRTQQQPTSRIVIIEGIYSLSTRLRPLEDLRVSITGGVHFDLVKRVLRDINRSGQAPEEIIQQISDTVYPMYKAFIEPDLKTAHLRIYNTFNPFSGFMDPTYILKSSKKVNKEDIQAFLKAQYSERTESETYDIYLLPPSEDPETCQSWLRMRNRDGRYNLMFEEWVCDGPFIISPRITFEVSVRILGGLMALGYEIGTIMKRTSVIHANDKLTVKLDTIEGMGKGFIQIQGKDRQAVAEAGKKLGLDGTYIARSYIEQVQLERLTASFQNVTEDMRQRFVVDGQTMLDESIIGTSPIGSFRSNSLKNAFRRASLGPSEPSPGGQEEVTSKRTASTRREIKPKEDHTFTGFAVGSSSPVNVPARRRTSTTEEHAQPLSLPRAPSTERSLLSQQIRVNSGNSIHSLANGIQHHDAKPPENSKAERMEEHFQFPASHSPGASMPDQASPPHMNGISHGGSSTGLPKRQPEMHNGVSQGMLGAHQGLHDGSDFESHASPQQGLVNTASPERQPASTQRQLECVPEPEWQPDAPPQHQLPLLAQPRLSHEVLRQHTASSNNLDGQAALIEQIQALTATHQNLAVQIQALIKVTSDQQHWSGHSLGSSLLSPIVVMLAVLFGVVLAKYFIV